MKAKISISRFAKPLAFSVIVLSIVFYDAFVYDVLAYHLPFSFLRIDFSNQSLLNLDSDLINRFKGFPPLWQFLIAPGILFNMPRLMLIPNLVALILLCATNKKAFKIPWHITIMIIFVFPISLFGFRSAYQDFFAGTTLLNGILIMLACRNKILSQQHVYLGGLLLFTSSLVKYQSLIGALLTLFALSFISAFNIIRKNESPRDFVIPLVLTLCIISIHPTVNYIKYSNPVYPINTPLFKGPEPNYTSTPSYTKRLGILKGPFNHILSATELDWLFRGVIPKYSIDSGHSQTQYGGLLDKRSFNGSGVNTDTGIVRTGGAFGLSYIFFLALSIYICWNSISCYNKYMARTSETIYPLNIQSFNVQIFFIYCICLFAPQAHELRYYMILLYIPVVITALYFWNSGKKNLITIVLLYSMTISFALNFSQPLKTTIEHIYLRNSLEYARNYPSRDFPSISKCLEELERLEIDQRTACLLILPDSKK